MESLIDRRCAGCVRDCDNELYYKCAQNDYYFYKRKTEESPLYWGERCKTCVNAIVDCDAKRAENCIDADYGLYEKKEPLIKKIELAQNKPKYKAFGAYGVPSTIVEGINKFFLENPQVEIVSITKLDAFESYYPGVMMVVREN